MTDRVVWSTPAMGMIPTSSTVRAGKYVTIAGRVAFDLGQTGKITFVAPITSAFPRGEYALRAHVVRKIPDLFGAKITLRKARRVGGNVSTILTCVGVQGGSVSNNVRFSDSAPKKFAIDPDTYYYWVQVDDFAKTPVRKGTVHATLGVSLVSMA